MVFFLHHLRLTGTFAETAAKQKSLILTAKSAGLPKINDFILLSPIILYFYSLVCF